MPSQGMGFSIATWNINSVRLRIGLVERLLKEWQPDVLCLQETKCPQGQFPSAPLKEIGYGHIAEFGQKGYHGVAIVSKRPFTAQTSHDFCSKGDSRHVSVTFEGARPIELHNFYIPAGGDEPDPKINEKFAHKLQFLDELEAWSTQKAKAKGHRILVGDLNIAPLVHDVWSHKDLLKVVSHTPIETDAMKRIMAAGTWHDVMRRHVRKTRNSIRGGAIAPRTGTPLIAAAVLTISGPMRHWRSEAVACRFIAMPGAGSSLPTMCR